MPEAAGITGRIRTTLAARNESQHHLSAAIGLDPTKLSKALSGRRRFGPLELKQIADHFDVSLDWLTAGDSGAPIGAGPLKFVAAPPPKSHSTSRSQTRQRIISAAWQLVAERGLSAVRMSDVARMCQVSAATVHYHFSNRHELLDEALLVSIRTAYDAQSADLMLISDPHERLLQLLEQQLPSSQEQLLEWSIWLQVWAQAALDPRIREAHTAAYERLLATIGEVLEYGRAEGAFRHLDSRLIAVRLAALVDGLGIQLLAGAPDRTIELMRSILHDFVQAQVVAYEPPAAITHASSATDDRRDD